MSFRRAKQPAASSPLCENAHAQKQVSGVKPWINGGYLVSTGNRALDDLFGGGQGLGTVLMLESDSFSGYAESILSYNVAQAMSSGHSVLIVTDSISSPERIASLLPYNQNIGKGAESDAAPIQQIDENDSEFNAEGSSCSDESHSCNSDCKSDPASGLKIAWQYEKYVLKGKRREQPKNISAQQPVPYCCSYDLSRRLQSSILERNPPEVFCVVSDDVDSNFASDYSSKLNICNCETLEQVLCDIRRAVVKFLSTSQSHQDQKSDRDSGVNSVVSVSRIFIPHLCNLAATYGFKDENIRQIVQFMIGIRQLVRDRHATVAFSLSPDNSPSVLTSRLKWAVDSVISVDSFAGREQFVPYEFKEFCGLLTVERLQQVGSMASFRPPGSKFGLKRDSRKLHIEPLHLPPEESRTGTSGTTAAAAMASKDGFAAIISPQFGHLESRERIEIKLDNSTTSSSKTNSENSERKPFQPVILKMDPIRSPSKYEEKSNTDESQPNSVNNGARSIFARARAEGLLVDYAGMAQGQAQRREPPLDPGSACAPNKNTSSSSLDF